MVEIGVITKPQALKGQFRVKPTNIVFDDMKELEEVYIKGKAYKVEKVILRDGFVIMQVEGINDINQVEPLRNTPIFIEEIDDEELGEDEYYIDDMLDCKVVDDKGVMIGKVIEVKAYGGASVITLETVDGEKLFPHARNVIKSLSVDDKVMVVDRKIFEEISLWK